MKLKKEFQNSIQEIKNQEPLLRWITPITKFRKVKKSLQQFGVMTLFSKEVPEHAGVFLHQVTSKQKCLKKKKKK